MKKIKQNVKTHWVGLTVLSMPMGVTWRTNLIQYQLKVCNCEQSHEENKPYLCPDMNLADFYLKHPWDVILDQRNIF